MDTPRLSKQVRRITVFDRDATGSLQPVVVFDRRRKKKKQTKGLRPFERFARTIGDANERFATTYARRHRRSNRKRRDGWLRDWPTNVFRAADKGQKEFDLGRILSW